MGFQVFPFDVSLCFSSLLGGFLLFWVTFHEHHPSTPPPPPPPSHTHTHTHTHTHHFPTSPPPNTHFTSRIPFGTNDAMLCICLIFFFFFFFFFFKRSSGLGGAAPAAGSAGFYLGAWLVPDFRGRNHDGLCVRRASRLLICVGVCLSYSSMCACVWGSSRIWTVCV